MSRSKSDKSDAPLDALEKIGVKITQEIQMTQAEKAERAQLPRATRPRLASTLVVSCGPSSNPKILMGCRSARHDFMPNVYVFPGGRVDRADSYAAYTGTVSARTETILESAYSPRRARACILAAVRETWEETGLMLGAPASKARNLTHPAYDDFREAGQLPDLTNIEAFARAVTPPHRHKRFDTWFFVKHLGDIPPPAVQDSHELQDVRWASFEDIQTLKTQRVTMMMLQVLQNYLKFDRPPPHIFYSRAIRGQFKMSQFP